MNEMTSLDPDQMQGPELYRVMIDAIIPRPIAFVSTTSPSGIGNLAPFSFFNGVSSQPPCLMFSVSRRRMPDGSAMKKDTLVNIEATGEFVVNMVSEAIAKPMHQTSADYPYGVDEMAKVGLTPLPSLKVRPPRVKESPLHFECALYKTLEIGDGSPGSSTIVVGRIIHVHVRSDAYENGRLLVRKLQPISRLGGTSYAKIGEIFDLPRPTF